MNTRIIVIALFFACASCADTDERCPLEAAEARDRNEAFESPESNDCHVCRAAPSCNDLCAWQAVYELSCSVQCRVLFTDKDIAAARAEYCGPAVEDQSADAD